jgi:hypothetical protein
VKQTYLKSVGVEQTHVLSADEEETYVPAIRWGKTDSLVRVSAGDEQTYLMLGGVDQTHL